MRDSRTAAALAIGLALVPVPPAAAQDLALGQETYMNACAGCHGEAADGAGPMTEILTIPVPDLTGLAARYGEFPWLRVIHTIDGTTGLRPHGGIMPIFGALFTGDTSVADAPDGTPVMVSARVLALVDYLESIQEPAE
jgi:mono/diheme cytochrome c family protein